MSVNYDDYLANQVEEHMRERLWYSNCCDAEMEEEEMMCPKCFEPCKAISEEDREYDRQCELEDQKMEERRDENNGY